MSGITERPLEVEVENAAVDIRTHPAARVSCGRLGKLEVVGEILRGYQPLVGVILRVPRDHVALLRRSVLGISFGHTNAGHVLARNPWPHLGQTLTLVLRPCCARAFEGMMNGVRGVRSCAGGDVNIPADLFDVGFKDAVVSAGLDEIVVLGKRRGLHSFFVIAGVSGMRIISVERKVVNDPDKLGNIHFSEQLTPRLPPRPG